MSSIFDVAPNVVSVNLLQYSMCFSGGYGIGKTTCLNEYLTKASPEGKKPLFLMFEDRWQHIQDIMALKINKWQDLERVLNELKNPKAKDLYSCIVIDTIDKLEELCTDFLVQKKSGAEILKDLGSFGEGTQRYRARLHVIDAIRRLGFPVHFTAQSVHSIDIANKVNPTLKTYNLKLNRNTLSYMSEGLSYLGYIYSDENEERYITFKNSVGDKCAFGNNDRIEYLKCSANLPISIKITDLNDTLIDCIKKNKNVTQEITLQPRYDEYTFDELLHQGMELGNLLIENGLSNEVMNICNKELGEDLQFNELTENQYDLCELVVDKLKRLKERKGL